jgi:hypothetical protein
MHIHTYIYTHLGPIVVGEIEIIHEFGGDHDSRQHQAVHVVRIQIVGAVIALSGEGGEGGME